MSSCARHVHRDAAHVLQNVRRQAGGHAVPHFQVILERLGRLLGPPESLGAVRRDQEGHDVGLEDLLVIFHVELPPSPVHVPGKMVHQVQTASGAAERGAEETAARVLPHRVMGPPLPAFDDALVDAVEDFKGVHDGAAREDLDLQPPARHLVDVGDHFVQQVNLRGPCGVRTLELPLDRCLQAQPPATGPPDRTTQQMLRLPKIRQLFS